MKALTVKAPWSHMITHCGKDIENRTWATRYRGPLAIHAGARSGWDKAAESSPLVRAAWREYVASLPHMNVAAMPIRRESLHIAFGAIVAVAELAGCHSSDDCDHVCPEPDGWGPDDSLPCTEHDGACNNYCSPWAMPGQWHWWLRNVRPLASPRPCRGYLGLWDTEDGR